MFKNETLTIKVESSNHNSTWFKVLHDNAYFLNKGELYVLNGSNQNILKKYEDADVKIVKAKDCLLVGNQNYGYDLIECDKPIVHEEKLKNFKLPFDSDSDEIYFFQRDGKLKKYKSGLYNTKAKVFTIEKDKILNIYFLKDDVFLNAENERIDLNGNTIWQPNLAELQISKTIGIWQNQLIAACSNHTLLSIDINTGDIITRWHELKGFEVGQFYKDVLPTPDDFVLDAKADKLIGVFHTFYFEIDLISKEIKYEDLKEELSAHGISDFRPFNNNPFTDDHFYLTAHTHLPEVPDVDFSSIIALNRHTKKVDWFHVFKEGGLGTNVPQITPTHLYQLDTKNNLYVFERKGS